MNNYTFKGPQPDQHPDPWRLHTLDTRYENPWIRVEHHEVVNPSGRPGIYGKVHYKNTAIGVVPLDHERHTWLVGQYRYTLKRYSWEIPEGGCPEGESLLEAAKRELLEETGLSAQTWQPLLETHLSNSVSDEYGVAFLALNLSQGHAEPEETELLEVRRLPFEEALGMVMTGEITDSLSIMAILKVNEWMRRGGF